MEELLYVFFGYALALIDMRVVRPELLDLRATTVLIHSIFMFANALTRCYYVSCAI